MQALKMVVALIASFAGLFVFSSPAAASNPTVTHPITGDYAVWYSGTNTLAVCDKSIGNGTAMAILEVLGGSTKHIFDGNGAASPCHNTGQLNVDDTKYAYLHICTNSSMSSCYRTSYSFPV